MRRLLAFSLVAGLVASGAAFAGRGDPREAFTAADQARAKAMLVRVADMGPAFASVPVRDRDTGYCAALDESDLTLTGSANSPTFTSTAEFVSSRAYVYRTRADASASFSRGTSGAGQKCLSEQLRRQIQGTAVRLVSFKPIAFPRLAQRSVAFRVVASRSGIRLYLDLIALQHSRAEVAIVYGTLLSPPPAAEERRLARLAAARMARAMRGA